MTFANPIEPVLATVDETEEMLSALREVDSEKMLDCAVELPTQITRAIQISETFHVGDLPLDHSYAHLVGLGGSAVAAELIEDMMAPKRNIIIHRGTMPPPDRNGVVISSYSGNTDEILEIAPKVIGGLKSVVYITSGGELALMGRNEGIPVWLMPPNYQPRGALGWSLGYMVSLYEKWRILHNTVVKLDWASQRLALSYEEVSLASHPLMQTAAPLAKMIHNKNTVLFYSIRCQGVAYRLAGQISENGKQLCFPVMLPEAMHNLVEGLAQRPADNWVFLFLSDPGDPPSLKASIQRVMELFEAKGFTCRSIPHLGEDPFENTLARIMIADFTSLLLAGLRGIDPTPIEVIKSLKLPQDASPLGFTGEEDSVINHYSPGEETE